MQWWEPEARNGAGVVQEAPLTLDETQQSASSIAEVLLHATDHLLSSAAVCAVETVAKEGGFGVTVAPNAQRTTHRKDSWVENELSKLSWLSALCEIKYVFQAS